MEDKYYDGPVIDTNRSLDEIEKDIENEKERCDKMISWEDVED